MLENRVNNNARGEASKVHALMADVIRGRAGSDDWPVDGLQEMRDALLTVKEVVDEILEHYLFEGVNVQFVSTLHVHPRAGRTVAASRALDAGIAIIEHAASLDDADAFISDFYVGDMAARLFELLEVNVDRMDLYAALTQSAEQLRVPDSLPLKSTIFVCGPAIASISLSVPRAIMISPRTAIASAIVPGSDVISCSSRVMIVALTYTLSAYNRISSVCRTTGQ